MKKKFHIIISKEDEQEFQKVLELLNISHTMKMYYVDSMISANDEVIYKINLSKYELLFIRLSIKTKQLKELSEEILHADTGLRG